MSTLTTHRGPRGLRPGLDLPRGPGGAFRETECGEQWGGVGKGAETLTNVEGRWLGAVARMKASLVTGGPRVLKVGSL